MGKDLKDPASESSRRAFLRDAGLTFAGGVAISGAAHAEAADSTRGEHPGPPTTPSSSNGIASEKGQRPIKIVVLANKHVRFEFEAEHMGICSIISTQGDVNHVPAASENYPLWELSMARGEQVERVTNNYRPCDDATVETLADGLQRLTIRWKRMRWWLEDNALSIEVRVELPADSGIARWYINVENKSDYWGLWSVAFPVIKSFPAAGSYDLAKPRFGGGGEFVRRLSEPVTATLPSGYWSMQFAALNTGANGLYLGTRDPDGRGKEFNINPGVGTQVVHYPENMAIAGSGYPNYYATELGVYTGTWVNAAKHYRAWALKQKWMQKGKLSERQDVPRIIKDIGLWVTEGFVWHPRPGMQAKGTGYVTASGAIEMPTEDNSLYLRAQRTSGVPMAIFWYQWYQSKFNHNFPNFLPPRIRNFKQRVAELVKAGWLVMPYINGVSADMDAPNFKEFAPAALTDHSGGYRMGFYGDSAGRLLSVCPTQKVWLDAIYKQARGLYDSYGVNGLYVDQVSATHFQPCFNPAHGHPVGGGRSWTDGYRELLSQLKAIPANETHPLALTSESTNEVFLDVLDGNLTWGQPSKNEIPLLQTVYSGYTLFFASPCDYAKSIRYFRWVQGCALIDGRQNGWVDILLYQPEYKDRAAYFTMCGVYRELSSKFLTYGELLDVLEFDHPVPVLNDADTQGLSSVQGRLWRSEDGHLGVLLANFADDATTVSFHIDPLLLGKGGAPFAINEITPNGPKRVGTGKGELRREQRIGGGELLFLEIST
jgi:hypothetical protein